MKIICAVHGIRTYGEWIDKFFDYTRKNSYYQNEPLIAYKYGFLLAVKSVNPFVKFYAVKNLMKKLRGIQKDYPDADLNIVAHSYGTELSYRAIKHSGEDGKGLIKVNKLILVASIIQIHEDFSETLKAGKLNELHNYCSFEDEVCRANPFGHSGYVGFMPLYAQKCTEQPYPELKVYNHQVKILEHGDYFKGDKYFQEWTDIIYKV